jgi:5-methylcytosine-specific restriction endonuclease McrA
MSERKAIPAKLRDKVLREAGYRCANPPCRTTLAIHLHHVIEVKAGGGDEFEKLMALCPTCHSLFHAYIISSLIPLNKVIPENTGDSQEN